MAKPIYEVKAQFFETLGHPARIRVLEILASGPRSVSLAEDPLDENSPDRTAER